MIAFMLTLALVAGDTSTSPVYDSIVVGKPCPLFVIRNIEGWKNDSMTIPNNSGKWLILDFWSAKCPGSIASFPETDRMSRKYADQASVLMVGLPDREGLGHGVWRDYKEKEKLQLPCAFEGIAFHQFGFHDVPQVVIIDNHGIVRGLVSGLDDKLLDSLLEGNKKYAERLKSTPFNFKSPMLLQGNGGIDDDYAYRSIITKWTPAQGSFRPGTVRYAVNGNLFQTTTCSLRDLYNMAFWGYSLFFRGMSDTAYGKICLRPIFEVKDTSLISPDYHLFKNLYSYSISIPGASFSQNRIRKMMQNDLENYFGYNAVIETRNTPYYGLVANDTAKLKLQTKGGDPSISGSIMAKYSLTNKKVAVLLSMISQSIDREGVFVDETGITTNIDITIDAISTDKDLVLSELRKNGLDIVTKKKPMQVVVVRDGQ